MLTRRLKWGLVAAGIVLTPCFAVVALAGAIACDGLRDDLRVVDVAVVLGNKGEEDGTPSRRLEAGLDRAIDLHKLGHFSRVIVSGGLGEEGLDEAEAMRDYLVTHGIGAEAILVDSGGLDTYSTAKNAARIMRDQGMSSAMVISPYFHVPRAALALRRSGVSEVHAAHARYFEPRDLYSSLREVAALGLYLIRRYE